MVFPASTEACELSTRRRLSLTRGSFCEAARAAKVSAEPALPPDATTAAAAALKGSGPPRPRPAKIVISSCSALEMQGDIGRYREITGRYGEITGR